MGNWMTLRGTLGLLLGAVLLLVLPAVAVPVGAPRVEEAQDVSVQGFTMRWGSVPGARSYRVEVARNRQFTSFLPGQRDRSVGLSRSHRVGGVRPGEEYWYRVRAVGADGMGEWSAARSVRLPLAAPVPLDARLLGPTSFEARWRPGSGAARHEVQVAEDHQFRRAARGLRQSRTNSPTSRVIEEAEAGSRLWWRVRSVGREGPGAWSAPQEVHLPPPAPRLLPPTLSTPRTVIARWERAPGATSYRVFVARDEAMRELLHAWRGRATGSGTAVTVPLLEPGTTYFLAVQGAGRGGAGPVSAPMAITTAPGAQ